MTNKTLIAVGLAAGLCAGAQPALAQFYVGAGIGYSNSSIDDNSVIVTGATASSVSKDESDNGWKLFAGYAFTPNIAVEAGWVDLGKFNIRRNVTAPAVGSLGGDLEYKGWFFDVVGKFPLANNFSLLGKVGGAYLESQVNASATGAVVVAPGTSLNPDSNDWSWKLGLGAQYDFTRTVGVRGEWERYFDAGSSNTAKGDIDLFSLNLIFKF